MMINPQGTMAFELKRAVEVEGNRFTINSPIDFRSVNRVGSLENSVRNK